MSSASPSPNSPTVGTPPSFSNSPPPLPSSPPPNPSNPPPSNPPSGPPPRPSSPPPDPSNSPPPNPPSASPPQLNPPPPVTPGAPPPTATLPRQSPPPSGVTPPPPLASPPPTSSPTYVNAPPPSVIPPSQPSSPPPTSAPPPRNPPARSSPPPPTSDPPGAPPTPLTNPPPPPTSIAPESPPQTRPPSNVPPPPTTRPPESSPPSPQPPNGPLPPPSPRAPENSPPQPPFVPPHSPATPPVSSRSPPAPPSLNSPPRSPPPTLPPLVRMSPPPPSIGSLAPHSPPSPSLVPSGNDSNNNSTDNTPGSSQSTSNAGIGTGAIVAIALVLSLLLLGVLGTAAHCMWKRKKKAPGHSGGHIMPTSIGSSPQPDSSLLKVQISAPNIGSGSGSSITYSPHEPGGLGNSRSWFTYEELVDATNGFSAQNLLGEGGFGLVYKGSLVDSREVAVKQLKIGGQQGEREFRSEVEIISRIHHRHLVSLVGYCISDDRRLLVYDYVPNNTLYFHLHGEGRPVMDWATRVKIAVGAARGIAYLHEDCHPRVIHRDIKSSNILLDNNFEARVSDFGLAKLALDANTHISTRVMGTFGYMAPEYASSGKLTEKSDVYSFGVVLLELVTGRKPVDTSQPLGEESLVEWARPLLSLAIETQEFQELADSRLEGNYFDGEMFRFIEAAAACVRHSSTKRPKMGQVVRAFDSMATSDLTNGMKVGESEIYDSAQESEEIRLFQRMAFGSQNYSTDFFSQNSWSSWGNQENSLRG